ncbi:unnamed protein product [Protopolystoma xenopodis]|uniref:Uncharacterized protein n=1 Tax=Protopolystoma xenopodis TaxID=117903 RepID=A0A3S5BL63_9PLAT|nr:unnamed protein product [Protopolystoma xenopodis]
MQTRHDELGDASTRAHSLDDIYYYGGQQICDWEAVVGHRPLNLQAGDKIRMYGNHWNGEAKVSINAGPEKKMAPTYKFKPCVLAAKMGEYRDSYDIGNTSFFDQSHF